MIDKINRMKTSTIIGIGLAIVLAMGCVIYGLIYSRSIDNTSIDDTGLPSSDTSIVESNTESENAESEPDYEALRLSIDELTIEYLEDTMNKFLSKPLYLAFRTSDNESEYDVLVHNNKNESVSYYSNGYTFTKNPDYSGVLVSGDGDVELIDTEIDQLDYLWLAIQSVKDGNGTMYVNDLTDEWEDIAYEYVIDFNGYDECEQFLSLVNPKYASTMRSYLEQSSISEGYDLEEKPINLRFIYVLTFLGVDSGGFYTYYGKDKLDLTTESWNKCYTMWFFKDFWEIGEWKFPDIYYNTNIQELLDNNDVKKAIEIVQAACDEVNESAQKYYESMVKG